MTESQSQQLQGYSSYNTQPTESALKLRLDTDRILESIEVDLRGEKITIVEQNGELKTIRSKIGDAKLNDRGIQDVMKCLRSVISPSTIQGNLERDEWEQFLFYLRQDLNEMIFINFPKYNIEEGNIKGVINDILSISLLVISRTIENGERNSYQQTVKHTESQTIEGKKGFLPI